MMYKGNALVKRPISILQIIYNKLISKPEVLGTFQRRLTYICYAGNIKLVFRRR